MTENITNAGAWYTCSVYMLGWYNLSEKKLITCLKNLYVRRLKIVPKRKLSGI